MNFEFRPRGLNWEEEKYKVITQAQKISVSMKDEYVSQEHVLLALFKEVDVDKKTDEFKFKGEHR